MCIKSIQDSVVITTISISLVYYKFCQGNNCIVNTMSPRSSTGAGTHTHTNKIKKYYLSFKGHKLRCTDL